MMNTNDLRDLRNRDRDTYVTLVFLAREANQKIAHSKWSERLEGFASGMGMAYKMLRNMKVGIYNLHTIGELERFSLDYWRNQRKVSHMIWGVKRNRAEKKIARLKRVK